MKKMISLAVVATTLALAPVASAESCYLTLKVGGANVQGEVTQKGREQTIECVAFTNEVSTVRDASGTPTGRRTYKPIKCVKRIDRTSPAILQALAQNKVVEATFRFFRAVPSTRVGAAGLEEQYYSVTVKNAHVAAVRQIIANPADAEAKIGAYEEVELTFSIISVTATGAPSPFDDSLPR